MQPALAAPSVVRPNRSLGLARSISPDIVASAYPNAAGKWAAIPATLPAADKVSYVYAYFDESVNVKKFVDPTEVVPTLDAAKTYSLTPTLHSFNVRKADEDQFAKLKTQIQLAFNATSPSAVGDLTWIFMNAIEIFAGKDPRKPRQLTSFLRDGTSGAPLLSQPKITVTAGTLNLRVQAWGQKVDGFWKQFISTVASIVSNPTAAAALQGFGIPSLTNDALQFVSHSLDVLMQRENLVKVWETGGLDFGVATGSTARFKMRAGLWLIVDRNYAAKTNFLQDHVLDIKLQSFQLLNKAGAAADANYLVSEMKFTPA